jgi:hypothetical protein
VLRQLKYVFPEASACTQTRGEFKTIDVVAYHATGLEYNSANALGHCDSYQHLGRSVPASLPVQVGFHLLARDSYQSRPWVVEYWKELYKSEKE